MSPRARLAFPGYATAAKFRALDPHLLYKNCSGSWVREWLTWLLAVTLPLATSPAPLCPATGSSQTCLLWHPRAQILSDTFVVIQDEIGTQEDGGGGLWQASQKSLATTGQC